MLHREQSLHLLGEEGGGLGKERGKWVGADQKMKALMESMSAGGEKRREREILVFKMKWQGLWEARIQDIDSCRRRAEGGKGGYVSCL